MSDTVDGFTAHCTAKLGDNPNYKGTVHDDAKARQMGYRAALVPGIMVLGYAADAIASRWGLPWLRQGSFSGRCRRGVYDRDPLRIVFAPDPDAGAGRGLRYDMFNEDGEQVALGTVGLPAEPDAPPSLADYPPSPFVSPPPTVAAGGFSPGDRFGSLEIPVTAEFFEQCLGEFGQTWPIFRQDGLFPPACIQRVVSNSINSSYRFATPPIFVATRAKNFDVVRLGDTLCTSGIIRDVYKRNGHDYYDADILVTAGWTRPVALLGRSMIYAARPGGEAL